jgi:altronate dehydratase small subunit
MIQRAFVLHPADNVATALDDLATGPVTLLGEGILHEVECLEQIRFGYKVALTDLGPGTLIVKNNVVIAEAFSEIRKGEMVHLHNIRSRFDERSGSLDHETGAPTEDFYR